MNWRRRLRRKGPVAKLRELDSVDQSAHGCAACRGIERRQQVTSEFVRTGQAMTLLAAKKSATIGCGNCAAWWEISFSADAAGEVMVHFAPHNPLTSSLD